MNALSKLKKTILAVLFPPTCLGCGKASETDLCEECRGEIRVNTSLFCPACGLRLADNKKVCHKDSQYLLAAATDYRNEAARNLLKFFKFKKWQRLQKPLGEILIQYLKSIPLTPTPNPFVVIPIPLHPDREAERGFNQSLLLAKIAADFYGLNLNADILKRVKNTKTQSLAKNHEERTQNVAGCFLVSNPKSVKGQNIILVDDVFTSGATMAEAAKTLRSAGARKIIALVIAKAR